MTFWDLVDKDPFLAMICAGFAAFTFVVSFYGAAILLAAATKRRAGRTVEITVDGDESTPSEGRPS